MPARGPGYSSATASLGTVLRETHKGRSWLTMGPGQLPPGLRCPPESSTPPRGQRPSRAEAGASGSLGTSVWRLRVPCPPAPPPHQGGQGPQHRPPCPCGSPACRETPRASGARWPSWVLFLQWGRLLQEPPFSLGGLSGDSGPTGLAPSKRPQGSPDPGLRELLVACSISTEDCPLSGPPPVTSADSGAGRSEGSKGWVHSGCQGWGLPPARTWMSAPRHAGPCPPLGSRPLGGSLGTPRAQCVPASPGGAAALLSSKHQQRRRPGGTGARAARPVLTVHGQRPLSPHHPPGQGGEAVCGLAGPRPCPGQRGPQEPPCAEQSCVSSLAI